MTCSKCKDTTCRCQPRPAPATGKPFEDARLEMQFLAIFSSKPTQQHTRGIK